MGNSSHIADIRGFEAFEKRPERRRRVGRELESWLCTGLNDGLAEVDDEKAAEIIRQIQAIPGGMKVGGILSDMCSGSGSLGIGWYEEDFKLATPKALEELAKILRRAGMKVTRLEKDRFMWYG